MASLYGPHMLAPDGSTGNNTHSSLGVHPAAYSLCAVLDIEAVGGTPTVTFKVQGTMDIAADGSADWFDLATVEPNSESVIAGGTGITKTAVGSYPLYVYNPLHRFVRRIRVVTSANTNVTYNAKLYQHITQQ